MYSDNQIEYTFLIPISCFIQSKIFMSIDIEELYRRGYETENIMLMIKQEFEENYVEDIDFDEDPLGWLEANC